MNSYSYQREAGQPVLERGPALLCVPSMFDSSKVKVLFTT